MRGNEALTLKVAQRMAFAQRIAGASFANKVRHHFDDGAPDQKLDLAETLSRPAAGTHLYVCGPNGFMDAVLSTARSSGWDERCLHREYFSARPADTRTDAGFDVVVASSGAIVRVPPGQSVVAALAGIGVEVPVSCEQGVCGTCLTRVLEGRPEHRDMYLTAQERERGDQFMPCCSRAKSGRLVLDL